MRMVPARRNSSKSSSRTTSCQEGRRRFSQAVYGEGAYRCSVHGMQFPPSREMEQLQAGDWELHCQRCENCLKPTPTPTAAPFNGHTPYALSKMVEERIALSMGNGGIPVTALRYAITYGPRQSLFNPYTGVVIYQYQAAQWATAGAL